MTMLTTLSELPTNFAIELTNNMIIQLIGEQADTYLHGQVTVNINALDDDTVRYCAHCDNKGKTWSISYVTRFNNGIFLITNKDAGAHSLAQLNKFGVFSKVDITDESDAYAQFFVSHALAPDILTDYFPSLPEQDLTSVCSDGAIVFKSDVKQGGYYLTLHRSLLTDFEQKLAQHNADIYDDAAYEAIMIDNAIPSVAGNTVNEYIPQMLNVQALGGIDFDKGCYMGQEVVARTRFLGKNKRAAYSFTLPNATNVNVGDTVEKQLGENWRRAGTIVRKAELTNETWFMAVLSNDTTEQDIHRLADQDSITCYPIPLPYNIEQAKSSLVKQRK